ncbi:MULTISPECIES: helix-turn-helix domain-containing protein [Staphylococcus]|uniref:helix-turn-helix domain-containing protein n=1 Tax=Staphylococcus TaxID=1279 RepID=UPI000946A338|nr:MULTISPECIES: helix-turn-helix transcriptional regulator [Staphylococcus]OLF32248.1 transcriptional regulator [Staphylococcus sp. 47.1]
MEYKSVRKILAENLKKLMDDKNVTQKQLSEEIGVSQSTISNWLQELKYPRIGHIQLLADYFNIPKSALTERKDKTQSEQNTMAAHFNKEDLTEEEIEEVNKFIEWIKNRDK